MPRIKLYASYASPPSRACKWAVLANNATDKVEIIGIDLALGEARTPEFLKMNPFHTVPTLKDEEAGVVLYESGAILQYLSQKLNWTKVALPKDDVVARAKAINYLHFHHTHTRSSLGHDAFVAVIKGSELDRTAAMSALHKAAKWLRPFDRALSTSGGYIAGSYATVADLHAYTEFALYLDDLYGLGLSNFDDYPHVHAWLARVRALPGFEAFEGVADFMSRARAKLN